MKNKSTNHKGLCRAILAFVLTISMLASSSIMCFAELNAATPENTAKAAVTGITNKGVSLGEGIIVKFYTNVGTKLSVEFGGQVTELTDEDGDYVYEFYGVTPQKMNDTITATLYDDNGGKVGDTATFSVKSYLTELLSLNYEGSGCNSLLQYNAMRELAVNILNYGAAAQSYVGYNTDALANAELTDEQKELATETIKVTGTDKAASGDAWIGAGVNFAEKLGLYFVFTAKSADEYTATINGEAVTAESYPSQGDNAYVIRYNGFNATNMNDVVTATLTKDGVADQTFTYSVRSYVYSNGADGNALSKLINSTYAYGFGAVAYTAEYEWEIEPTLEADGSYEIKEDSKKGYDFTDSKYASGTVTKLNFTDWNTVTEKTTDSTTPVVTTFKQNKPDVNLKVVKGSENYISLNGTLYSQYDYQKANVENEVEIGYNDGAWSYDAISAQTVTDLTTYNAPLTITGTVTVNSSSTWDFNAVRVTLGTADKAATVTSIPAVRVWDAGHMLVSENSTLNVNSSFTIGSGGSKDENKTSTLTVDGAVNIDKGILSSAKLSTNADYEFGFVPQLYVRKGTVTALYYCGQSLQVGSKADSTCVGTLNLTGASLGKSSMLPNEYFSIYLQYKTFSSRYVFARGSLSMTGETAGTGKYTCIGAAYQSATSYILFDENMSVSVTPGKTNFQGVIGKRHNGSAALYVNFHDGCLNNADNVIWTSTTVGGSKVSGFKYVNMKVNETIKRVCVADYTTYSSGSYKMSALTDDLIVPENAVLTTSEATLNLGFIGTFNQGTYVDAGGTTHTIYYQIVD